MAVSWCVCVCVCVFQENPQTSRCLGVFGLSLYTQERDLREVFEHYGAVDEVQIVYDHQSGRSRGFAFVYMRNHDDAVEVTYHCSHLLCNSLNSLLSSGKVKSHKSKPLSGAQQECLLLPRCWSCQ